MLACGQRLGADAERLERRIEHPVQRLRAEPLAVADLVLHANDGCALAQDATGAF